MFSSLFSRFQNYLPGLASVAAIILVTAFSIDAYRFLQFIKTTFETSARLAGELLTSAY